MTTTTRTRRIRRAALVIGGLTAVGIVALPGAAFADTYNAALLGTGRSVCSSQHASYQAKLDGTATNKGAKFRVYKDGVQLAASFNDYSAEFRTSLGNFPGPGYYTICGLNKQATNSFVTVRVRTDGEI